MQCEMSNNSIGDTTRSRPSATFPPGSFFIREMTCHRCKLLNLPCAEPEIVDKCQNCHNSAALCTWWRASASSSPRWSNENAVNQTQPTDSAPLKVTINPKRAAPAERPKPSQQHRIKVRFCQSPNSLGENGTESHADLAPEAPHQKPQIQPLDKRVSNHQTLNVRSVQQKVWPGIRQHCLTCNKHKPKCQGKHEGKFIHIIDGSRLPDKNLKSQFKSLVLLHHKSVLNKDVIACREAFAAITDLPFVPEHLKSETLAVASKACKRCAHERKKCFYLRDSLCCQACVRSRRDCVYEDQPPRLKRKRTEDESEPQIEAITIDSDTEVDADPPTRRRKRLKLNVELRSSIKNRLIDVKNGVFDSADTTALSEPEVDPCPEIEIFEELEL